VGKQVGLATVIPYTRESLASQCRDAMAGPTAARRGWWQGWCGKAKGGALAGQAGVRAGARPPSVLGPQRRGGTAAQRGRARPLQRFRGARVCVGKDKTTARCVRVGARVWCSCGVAWWGRAARASQGRKV
jgi:hypothetical protein